MNTDCLDIRKNILKASYQSGHGHIPTSFSIVEMAYAVYKHMNHDPQKPQWEERDIFILSKGHASLGYYCTLAHFGYLSEEELATFGAYQSRLGCHSDRLKAPGVELSTGSLGHGIGVGVGIALAFKIQKSPRQVYVIIGDGESNEGSVWEAMMVATHQNLPNLTILYDHNNSQTRCLQIPNPAERFQAFGAQVHEVNGHETEDIVAALKKPAEQTKVIVCNNQKGYGCKTLVDDMFAWHRRSPNEAELHQLLEELHA